MKTASFIDLYVAELEELVSGAGLVGKPLALVAEVVSDPLLKRTLTDHGEHTVFQKRRIEALLQSRHVSSKPHTDQAMQGLLTELAKMSKLLEPSDVRDAGLIISLQKLAHYQIAAYSGAAALASLLRLQDDTQLLHQALEEQERFNASLTELLERQLMHKNCNRDGIPAQAGARPDG